MSIHHDMHYLRSVLWIKFVLDQQYIQSLIKALNITVKSYLHSIRSVTNQIIDNLRSTTDDLIKPCFMEQNLKQGQS